MTSSSRGLWLCVCILLASGAACTTARNAAVPLVLVHAEKDLRCPQKKIRLERKLGGRYRALGCGRSATYHSACEGLQCSVGEEASSPQAWHDRPDPDSLEAQR